MNAVTKSTSVDQIDICLQNVAVGIGDIIADRHFPAAYFADSVFIRNQKIECCLADFFAEDLLQSGILFIDQLFHFLIFPLISGEEDCGNRAVLADDQLAGIFHLGADGGQNDILAVLVGIGIARYGHMGMAVENSIDTAGVMNQGDRIIRRKLRQGAEMGKQDDILRSFPAGLVNCALNLFSQFRSVIAAAEIIDKLIVFPEYRRGGRSD